MASNLTHYRNPFRDPLRSSQVGTTEGTGEGEDEEIVIVKKPDLFVLKETEKREALVIEID